MGKERSGFGFFGDWFCCLFLLGLGSGSTLEKTSDSSALVGVGVGGASPGHTGITVDKSVEFSYEELAKATNDFSLANKIGQGGFGSVYYAELRGEVCSFYFILLIHYNMIEWEKEIRIKDQT